ncbi:MAG TPA: four-carbon acid sugar kinase family protein, partial [Sedimentisphaerales bacterium]
MEVMTISWEACRSSMPPELDAKEVDPLWRAAVASIKSKIIVLDDDPTGIQTVHSVPVYTDWEVATLRHVLDDPSHVVFILTNSRALDAAETASLHRLIARRLVEASKESDASFIVMSRSDSTLRGHYPIETSCLFEELSKKKTIDAEIIAPFFLEGGRITIDDVHYVKDGDLLTPAAKTEFARDAVFGYSSSNMKQWVEEKTGGRFPAKEVASISLSSLRARDIEGIVQTLCDVRGFRKIIVNATNYEDLKVFVMALAQAMSQGHNFIFRTAAGMV